MLLPEARQAIAKSAQILFDCGYMTEAYRMLAIFQDLTGGPIQSGIDESAGFEREKYVRRRSTPTELEKDEFLAAVQRVYIPPGIAHGPLVPDQRMSEWEEAQW